MFDFTRELLSDIENRQPVAVAMVTAADGASPARIRSPSHRPGQLRGANYRKPCQRRAGPAQVLNTSASYIGPIGSQRKIGLIMDHLRADGFTTEQLARVRAPIRLDLGGREPAEIALAVLAVIEAVHHGSRGHCRLTDQNVINEKEAVVNKMPFGKGICCLPSVEGVTYLKVGSQRRTVGMVGLETAFQQLYVLRCEPDTVADPELVDMARKSNHIPKGAAIEAEYAAALREAYARFCDRRTRK